MNYKNIIFDYDGTLCDTHNAILHSVNKTFDYFGVKKPDEELTKQVIGKGTSLQQTFLELNKSLQPKETPNWIKIYREIYSLESNNYTELYPSVQSVFEQLDQSNINIIIISNKGISAVEDSLKVFDLERFCKAVIGDGFMNTKYKLKPDPFVFEDYIFPKFQGNKNDYLVVGDTDKDILFAQNIEIDSCWCKYGFGNNEKCISENPTHIIDGMDEFITKVLLPKAL